MQIVAQEGKDIFYRYQNSFSFGKKTGIDLPGEESGLIISHDNLNSTELATSSFGQSFTTTMIQMASAYSSLVNGGFYYEPHVVKQIINDNGATVKEYKELLLKQTVSEKTSDFIQNYMYQTVETGTAQGAQVPGYAVGGKTGTAQKLPRDAKTYVVSFLGAVPAINPEIVIYVMIDEPQNVVKQADSSIATKFASRIMTEILPALGIYPEGDIDYLLPSEEEADGNLDENANSANSNNASLNTNDTQNSNSTNETNDTEGTEDTEDTENPGNTEEADQDNTSQEDNSTSNEDTSINEDELTQDPTGTTENPDSQTNQQTSQDPNSTNETQNLGEDEFNADALD
jgi:stage V sporulation protein D (sporulation-specific penicillin-binding protein)